jgi:fructokinase
MPVVISHGEMLIDFVSTVNGVSLIEAPSFLKAAGGAPANMAVGSARLGVPAGFLGQVGDDAFGHSAICRYANAVGALTTTRRGAIPALPTAEQVETFLNSRPRETPLENLG